MSISSSVFLLAGMEYLYASMSPMPYVVVAVGALVVMQSSVQRNLGRKQRMGPLVSFAGVTAGAIAATVVLTMYGAPMYTREIAFAIMVLAGVYFFERVSRTD